MRLSTLLLSCAVVACAALGATPSARAAAPVATPIPNAQAPSAAETVGSPAPFAAGSPVPNESPTPLNAAPLTGGAVGSGTLAVPFVSAPPMLAPAAKWPGAASVTLPFDIAHARSASERTVASVENDGQYLYVRFAAEQREPIAAAQRTNDANGGSDDEVGVLLWPNDSAGFFYQYLVTPNGTHYESSSENSNYQPTWTSTAGTRPGGYDAVMRVPLSAIRGAHSGTWRVQFARIVHATGETQVWRFDRSQTSASSLTYAGTATLGGVAAAGRPKPRLAVYGLGAVAAPRAGGSTSRLGADLAVPITATTSLLATIHPDFSNVELDQQSISPTAFARYYSEVRPFFTQGAGFYDQLNCDVCSNISELYTPSIPTPKRGYAIEGQQGQVSFGTFDAIGDGRDDLASAASYQTKDLHWNASLQRVSATAPGFHDDTTTTGIAYSDLKHLSGYFDYGNDQGTRVADASDAQRYDFGGGYGTPTFALFGSTRKVGDFYQPADGFVQHPGIAGYALYTNKIWLLKGPDVLQSVSLGAVLDRYMGRTQGFNQTDNTVLLDVLTKSSLDAQVSIGSNYVRTPDGVLQPVSQNGVGLVYHSGSQQNPGNFGQHGSASYPTSYTFNTGRYGDGRLSTSSRSTSFRGGDRGIVSFEVDDTDQQFPHGPPLVQWFERAGYTYQIAGDTSVAVGVRKVVGDAPTPNGGGNCAGTCTNVSFSFHEKTQHSEIYVGYGDASTLDTVPQALVKFIYYLGAEKGS